MGAEHARPAGGRRTGPRLSDQALTLLAAALVVALLAVVGGWLTLRSPGLHPVRIPSFSRA